MSPTAAPALSLERLLPFWTEVFGVPEGVFTGVWSAVPEGRRRTFFHTEAGELLSTVQVYVLPLNGAEVGCVANVATHESARGRGLSTDLLNEAIRGMKGEGIDLSYLFTGVPHHYARLGWQATDETIRRIQSQKKAIAPDEAAPDLERMAALYAQDPPPFALLRDEAWWRNVVAPRLTDRLIWTAPDAYLVARRGESLTIEETAGDEAARKRLVLGAAAWAGGTATLHGNLEIGTPDVRPGGMLRGGAMPPNAWFSGLDHF